MTDEEHKTRSLELIAKLERHEYNQQNIDELFLLYNERLTPREMGRSCAGCRARVFRRLKQYYEQK